MQHRWQKRAGSYSQYSTLSLSFEVIPNVIPKVIHCTHTHPHAHELGTEAYGFIEKTETIRYKLCLYFVIWFT